MSIETVIHKITNDSAFTQAMAKNPAATLEEHGMNLQAEELKALQAALSEMGSKTISGVVDEPTEWFSPQFKGVADEPTEWFAPPFHNEIA